MQKLTKESLRTLLEARVLKREKQLRDIPNPALLHDGNKVAKRLARAVNNGEKICVVGDYDVDGVTSVAIIKEFFKLIDYPLEIVIPNRFRDGYGVSPALLERIDANVIVTVDNGITAVAAGEVCANRGIDLLITDHHTPPAVLPKAYAIVDPKLSTCDYPFKEICGAEVIWLVLGLLKKELHADVNMRGFVDFLALGIVADIMPLVDVNRALVQDGLKMLMQGERASSIVIREFLNKTTIGSEDIAFMIAPRLNSAGRLDDASLAVEFLTAASIEEAYVCFEKLNNLNEKRKKIESDTTKEAIALANDEDEVIIVAKEGWHEGVVGIVASRLVEHFSKPALVLSINGNTAKGSGRSLADVNMFMLLQEHKGLFEKFGGHAMAVGVSLQVENLKQLQENLNKAARKLPKEAFVVKDELLGVLDAKAIDFSLLEILEEFEPYGEANPKPKFLLKDAKVLEVKVFGKEKNHCRIKVQMDSNKGIFHELVLFRSVVDSAQKSLSCSYTISRNEFNNITTMQLHVNKIYG